MKKRIFDAHRKCVAGLVFNQRSYGQLGEDLVIENHLQWLGVNTEHGSYIDLGGFHPVIGSNTFKFYRKGWSGTVVEASKEKIKLFRIYRKRDTSIHAAVVPKEWDRDSIVFVKRGDFSEGDSIDYRGSGIAAEAPVKTEQESKKSCPRSRLKTSSMGI